MILTCQRCKKKSNDKTEKELFQDGWDFPGKYFSAPFVTCPDCPTAPLLIEQLSSKTGEPHGNTSTQKH